MRCGYTMFMVEYGGKEANAVESILNYLYGTYAPEALILYGSYADGMDNEGSDFDALILADREAHHDVSIVDGVQMDVWVYPADYFAADDALDEAVQIADGVVLHDSQGKGTALRARVRDYIAAQPGKSAGENEESLAWCRKMLARSARTDAEGLYRWHWLLTDSLEIACDLLHQPYCGPKKSLRWLENAHPDVYAAYARALAEFTQEALTAWVKCLEKLL